MAKHGTTSRWRRGCRCQWCTEAHLKDLRDRGRAAAERALPPDARDTALTSARQAHNPTQIATAVGVPVQRLWAYARANPGWGRQFDNALTAGRDPDIEHGASGYRRHGCRCPQCRAAHRGRPAPSEPAPVRTMIHEPTGWIVDPDLGHIYGVRQGSVGHRLGGPDHRGTMRATHRRNGVQTQWRLAVVIWEAVKGVRLPDGHKIVTKDGDKTNLRYENLACLPSSQALGGVARRARAKMLGYDHTNPLETAAAYYREHGHMPPVAYVTPGGYPLGRHLSYVRSRRRGARPPALTPEEIAAWEAAGMDWADQRA